MSEPKSAGSPGEDRCDVYGLTSSRNGTIRYIGQAHDGAAARHKVWLTKARTGYPGRVCDWIRDEIEAGHKIEVTVILADGRWNVDEIEQIAAHRAAGVPLLNVSKGGNWWVGRKRDGIRAAPPAPKPPPSDAKPHAALRSLSLELQRRRRWGRWG